LGTDIVRQQEGKDMKLYLILLKLYLAVSGTIFLLVGLFHLFRLFNQWEITVAESTLPQILSCIGFPVSTGYFLWAVWLFRKSSKGRLSHLTP
jgi:hypothetical protein